LAPHYSGFSVGQYHERAGTAAAEAGVRFRGLDSWHLTEAFVAHQAASLTEQLREMPDATKVVFTAHSLPERVLADDPYPEQLAASARAIAERVGLDQWSDWSIGWQSAGRTPEPWRGPDILDIIRELAATGRADGVVVVPQGFTADHLEVLYDLDIEASGVASDVGLAFRRTAVVNDDPQVMGAIATLARELADN
ncbi:MAG: ferrochelatase, partial [Actinomycetes bacterium]